MYYINSFQFFHDEEGWTWLAQKLMAELFDVTAANVSTHIKNIWRGRVCTKFNH
jgi:hypothetical protein